MMMQTLPHSQRVALAAIRRAPLKAHPKGYWRFDYKGRTRYFRYETVMPLVALGLAVREGNLIKDNPAS